MKVKRFSNKIFIIFLFLIVVLVIPNIVISQDHNIKFEHINIEHGLSQNSINCIYQDSLGFLWFGTEDGLNRYDGYNFTIFENNPDNSNSLSHNFVYSIIEDQPGIFWIGTWGGGLNKFDSEYGRFNKFKNDKTNSNSLSNNKIYSIIKDQEGNLWIGTDNGLNKFSPENEFFVRYFPEKFSRNKLENYTILNLYEDKSGFIWIGTQGDGLDKFNPKTGVFKNFSNNSENPDSISSNYVWSIIEDHSGNLWIGTKKGLNKLIPDKGIFKKYFHDINDPNSLSNDSVFFLYEDNLHYIWIGTWGGGISKLDPNSEKFYHFYHDPQQSMSLSNDYISYIYKDSGDILWLGTYGGGLNKFHPKNDVFQHYSDNPGNPNTINNNNILSLLRDRSGNLWVGTRGGGLNRFDPDKKKWEYYTSNSKKMESITHNSVWSIFEDKRGSIWVGTRKGLDLFDPKTYIFKHISLKIKGKAKEKRRFITTIGQDLSNNIWIGTFSKGIFRYNLEKETLEHFISDPKRSSSLSSNKIFSILIDSKGILWVGTYGGGLNQYNSKTKTFKRFQHQPDNRLSISHNIVLCIFEDNTGAIWIGTLGGGLNKFDRKTERFIRFGKKDGLPSTIINGILEETLSSNKKPNLWLSTYKGISRFNTHEGTFKNFVLKDGLQSSEFNKGAYYKGKNGRMYFGGINGFNIIFPDRIKDNLHIPKTVITGFQIFNRDADLKKSIINLKNLVLSHKDYVFSFEFATLDFTSPQKNRYAYKMEGFSDDWLETSSKKRFATYTNLNPGEYIFKVKGTNNDGKWDEIGTSIKIKIIPPFWGTLWFKIFAFIFFVFFSYLVIHLSRKYVVLINFWKKKKHISSFKLLDKIGSGGMGTIYRASNLMNKNETVAIKVLNSELFDDENSRKRFKQEAVIIDQLDHPNIVKVIERGISGENLYMAMELLEGITLADKINKDQHIKFPEIIHIVKQVLDAIEKVHRKNIIHRDIKPENVMLIINKGDENFVKLLDFGLATMQYQTRLTQTGIVIGTINYMAPEQIIESITTKSSDVYSLGVMLYEMSTGRKPFIGESVISLMKQIIDIDPIEPIKFRQDIPENLNKLILKMMDKDSNKRPELSEIINIINLL